MRAELRAFVALTKPGITRMVLVSAAAGFWLAADTLDLALLGVTLAGTALVASGTNALNQWWERERDARMRRTRHRPLPAGTLAPGPVLVFAAGLGAAGVVVLARYVNALTAALAALTLLSYVLWYTPLKARTPLATLVGAVPGALPVVGGWTAAGGALNPGALLLFGVLFCWQVPHFLALDWLYREDYARGGFRTLAVLDPSGAASARQSLLYAVLLVPLPILLAWQGPVTAPAAGAAALAGLGLVALCAGFARQRSAGAARRVFLGSIAYLPVVLLALTVGKR